MILQIFQNKVLVIKIFKWDTLQVELCLFKPNCSIEWHHHKLANIEVMHLWGDAKYKVQYQNGKGREKEVSLFDIFKCFSVRAEVSHAADIFNLGLITLSIQKWKVNPTTVTNDFIKD